MSGYFEGVLVLLAINVVFAYGAFLPMAAGQLNLGVAGFAAIGGYVSAFLSNNTPIPAALAIPLGGLAAGLVALVVAVPVLRTRGIYLALATFALGRDRAGDDSQSRGRRRRGRLSCRDLHPLSGRCGFAAGVVACWYALLFATRFGIAIRAVHDDERVADLMGLNVRAFQVAAFTLGSAIAGIGGGLYAHHFSFIEAQYFNISLSASPSCSMCCSAARKACLDHCSARRYLRCCPSCCAAATHWRYVLFAAIVIVVMVAAPARAGHRA